MKLCRTCGRPINRGSTAGTGHNGVCLVCLVAASLATFVYRGKP